MTAKNLAITVGAVLLAGLVLWTIYNGPLWVKKVKNATVPDTATTTFPATPSISSATGNGKADISSPELEYGYATSASPANAKGAVTGAAYPALDRPVVIPTGFSLEDAALIRARINKLIDAIEKNPSNGALWADLGMARKGIEDYEGATDAYQYALKMMPNNAVTAENLGVLYGDYLRNYPKAEEYYRLSIAIDKTAPHRYLRLFELYRYSLQNSTKAQAILEEGLRAIPGEPSLQALLDEFQ